MNKIILLLVLCASFTSKAANWELFPLNQKSYYRVNNHAITPESIEMIMFDSSYVSQGTEVSINRKKFYTQQFGGCGDTLSNLISMNDPYFIDTTFNTNDSVSINSNFTRTGIYFLPKASIGSSWGFTTYTNMSITCTTITLDTVFGLVDSIKTFVIQEGVITVTDPLSNHPFRLSKTFGLIDYIPFSDLVNGLFNGRTHFSDEHLIGADNGQVYGWSLPIWSDYFPYHTGDVILWIHQYRLPPFYAAQGSDYYRDSLTSVINYPDSIVLDIFRVITTFTGNITTTNHHQVYDKAYYSQCFDSEPYSPIFAFGGPEFYITPQINILTDTITGAPYFQRIISNSGYVLDSTTCTFSQGFDIFDEYTYSALYGLERECHSAFFYDCDFLVAARLNGVTYGDINLSVGEIDNPVFIKSFPVPAANKITLDTDYKIESIEVFSAIGQNILNLKKIDSNELDISMLKPGIYFLKIRVDNKNYYSKIIKQ